MWKFSRSSFLAIVLVTATALVISCQKSEDDLNPMTGSEQALNSELSVLSFGPDPVESCFRPARRVRDLATLREFSCSSSEISPPVLTDSKGTLDDGGSKGCGELFSFCGFGGESEVLYFGIDPNLPNTIESDALFCLDVCSEAAISSKTQREIYDKAVALARSKRPQRSNGTLMNIAQLDFYIALDPVNLKFVVEMAVLYC
ncbi:MAG: hypothetical protein AAF990_06955 [Bacteroidota bacterium]